ncbi:LURP-one-related family protein [Paucibacter soli]|uniref:LURP-one-related family protein n=1 Tax=Paucibacter soli TaxID=3133433 RepID=UPI0030AE2D67
MARQLSIANRLLSWRERFSIEDENGKVLYETSWRLRSWRTFWHVNKEGREVARFRRKLLAWRPTWMVHIGEHQFLMRRDFAWFSRSTHVIGGPFHGAKLSGNILDSSFKLERGAQIIAQADAKLLTLRNRHTVDLKLDSTDNELLCAVMMSHLMVQKAQEKREAQSSSSIGID